MHTVIITITTKKKKNHNQNAMPTFSKPVQEEILQNARKKTLNPKLTSIDNVHEDAIKKRKYLEESTSSKSTHPISAPKKTPATKNNATAQPKPINVMNYSFFFFSSLTDTFMPYAFHFAYQT
jgi:hypothetical protein